MANFLSLSLWKAPTRCWEQGPFSSSDPLALTGNIHTEQLKDVTKIKQNMFSEVSHIERLENVTEMFEAVIVLCGAKDIVRMRLVNRHWKNTIDNSLQAQQVLFRRPQRNGKVLQLKTDVDPNFFTISEYRVANHLPLSQIQPGTKYSIPAHVNHFICRRTPSSAQAPLNRRATLGETIRIKPSLATPWLLAHATHDITNRENRTNRLHPSSPLLQGAKDPSEQLLNMYLTQPPAKKATISFLGNLFFVPVERAEGLRLCDVLNALEGTKALQGILSIWHKIPKERKKIEVNLHGAFDGGVEGVVFVRRGEWRVVDKVIDAAAAAADSEAVEFTME